MLRAVQVFVISTLLLTGCGGGSSSSDEAPLFSTKEALGQSLFNDQSLSFDRTQSCATCHNPEHAFVDDRTNITGEPGAVSLGDDQTSLGDRNTPTAMYASQAPEFFNGVRTRFNSQQDDYSGFIGGQFLDGRATNLAEQAKGPFLNPVEMAMPDKAAVMDRVMENPDYVDSFELLYGLDIFEDVDVAYDALADAIQAFEQTEGFSPFTSKYDQFVAGEYTYDPLALATLGKSLFFSQQFTNCATCHQLKPNSSAGETFTGYEYHNIGVPVNENARAHNGVTEVDPGLLNNDAVTNESEKGKYKVPTLRNIGVTAPYMHNGVFQELGTVVKFYDQHLEGSEFTENPETGLAWADPEVADNMSTTELQDGRTLDEEEVQALVCFLFSLTDEAFETMLPESVNDCGL